MGGLFSSTDSNYTQQTVRGNFGHLPEYSPPRNSNYTTSGSLYNQSTFRDNNFETPTDRQKLENIVRRIRNLQINEDKERVPDKEVSVLNLTIFGLYCSRSLTNDVVTFMQLTTTDFEYLKITQKITNKQNFKVDRIEKIINPYLQKAYELKKEQKKRTYPQLQEQLLFHGTKEENVDNICKMNFNWRLCETHKYGQGVSFSPNSTYASVYSDEYNFYKIMLVAKVMIGRSCIGNENMKLPPRGYDTSQKGDDGIVIVKFEDNEFYPVYKITYHLKKQNQHRKKFNNLNKGRNLKQSIIAEQIE